MSGYLSVDGKVRNEIVIERSRFITTVAYIDSAEQAREILASVRKEFSDATHNCYAYVVGGEQKSSDDGEPQGTAGVPIMEVIKRRNLTSTIAIVTRYFGGIKLGAAGLVGAYTRAVAETLDKSAVLEHIYSNIMSVELDYTVYDKAVRQIGDTVEIVRCDYGDTINLQFAVAVENTDTVCAKLQELTSGKAEPKIIETKYYTYKR